MAGLNEGRQHLIDGDGEAVFLRKFNHGPVERLNFRPSSCFDVLQHAAMVVFCAGQHLS